MRLVYYDESGDDGYPRYSSPIFVLTALYLHYTQWQTVLTAFVEFRRQLKECYGVPIKMEMHTRHFLGNKSPFDHLAFDEALRMSIVGEWCDLLGRLPLRMINVAIVKPRISSTDYRVLDRALTFSIQRIENDLDPDTHPEEKFLIITDPGREGAMRATSRKLQKINYIPSKYGTESINRPITTLIEDPLPKDSKQSHFIQAADLVSYVAYLHVALSTGAASVPVRLRPFITGMTVQGWMEGLKPALNLEASRRDPYGVFVHPA